MSKFFQTSDSAALFPEYVSRAVRQGMEQADVLQKIVATTTVIDGMDYRAIESVENGERLTAAEVAEGASLPTDHGAGEGYAYGDAQAGSYAGGLL